MKQPEHIEHIDLSQESLNDTAHDMSAHHEDYRMEYLKLAGVLVLIFLGALMHYTTFDLGGNGFLDSFMGVFFLTFASFKLIGLQDFVIGFADYDIIAKRFPFYSYLYPFLQLFFAIMYLMIGASRWTDVLVAVVSLIGAYGIWQTLKQKREFHCVCLGNVIQLPLSRVSFIEDSGMAAMAIVMLVTR